MSNIYEIASNYKEVSEMIYDENVDMQMILDTLESIDGDFEEKADNRAKIIKELDAKAKAREDEAKRLTESAKVLKNRAKRITDGLYDAMKIANKPKFATDLFSFSIAKNGGKQTLTVDGEVPKEYTKTIIENDTDKIRADLEAGKELAFAHLEPRGESLRIS